MLVLDAGQARPQQQLLQVELVLHLLDLLADVLGSAEQHVARVQKLIAQKIELVVGVGEYFSGISVVTEAAEVTHPVHVPHHGFAREFLGLFHGLGDKQVPEDRHTLAHRCLAPPTLRQGIAVQLETGNQRVGGWYPEHHVDARLAGAANRRIGVDHAPQRRVRSLQWPGNQRERGDMAGFGVGVLRERRAHLVIEGHARLRKGIELTVIGEELVGPGRTNDLERFIEQRPIDLGVTNIGHRIHVQRFARIHPSAHADLDPATGEVIEHGDIFSDLDRVSERDDVGCLADADLLGVGGEVGAHQDGIWANFEPFVTEVVLGCPYRVPAVGVAIPGDFSRFLDQLSEGLLEAQVVLVEEIAEAHRKPPRSGAIRVGDWAHTFSPRCLPDSRFFRCYTALISQFQKVIRQVRRFPLGEKRLPRTKV